MGDEDDFNFKDIGNLALKKSSEKNTLEKILDKTQKTQTSENKAQEVKNNSNNSFYELSKEVKTEIKDFKKTELELESVIKTARAHIGDYKKTMEGVKENLPPKEIPVVEKQIEKLIDLNEQKIKLIDKYKNKEISEKEYRLKKYNLDTQITQESKKFDLLMSDIYKKNEKNLNEKQKEWFKDLFEQNQKMLGEIYSEIIGVGNGNSEVNLHSERLIQALLAQVQLANEKTKKKQDEIMLEYLDKLAFIKDSIKELSNSKKEDENKFKEVANYYETYNHETTELTNTIKAAQKFVIITNIKNENIRETQIREYGKNTKIKFENGKESTPNQDYLERTLPVRL